jgi:type VI secretion system secreted protein Hcp
MAGYAAGVGSHADMFLKLDGIEGESADDKHKGEIEILNYSWGATQPGSAGRGGGAGVGKVQLHDFSFSKMMDKASPKLFEYCAKGKHLPLITLTCRKAGGEQQEYLKIVMKDAIVSSITNSSSGGASLPVESVSFNLGSIELDYKPQKSDGSLGGVVKAGWDAITNKPIS